MLLTSAHVTYTNHKIRRKRKSKIQNKSQQLINEYEDYAY